MDGVVEIITGRERRRRWSVADKLGIVAESREPGTLVRAVAARHGVCESLVFTWWREVRNGVLSGGHALIPAIRNRSSGRSHKPRRLESDDLPD